MHGASLSVERSLHCPTCPSSHPTERKRQHNLMVGCMNAWSWLFTAPHLWLLPPGGDVLPAARCRRSSAALKPAPISPWPPPAPCPVAAKESSSGTCGLPGLPGRGLVGLSCRSHTKHLQQDTCMEFISTGCLSMGPAYCCHATYMRCNSHTLDGLSSKSGMHMLACVHMAQHAR